MEEPISAASGGRRSGGKGRVKMASKRNRSRAGVIAALATLVLTAALAASASAAPPDVENHPLLEPVDAQNWVDQAELTHADFNPVPDRRPSSTTRRARRPRTSTRRRSSWSTSPTSRS